MHFARKTLLWSGVATWIITGGCKIKEMLENDESRQEQSPSTAPAPESGISSGSNKIFGWSDLEEVLQVENGTIMELSGSVSESGRAIVVWKQVDRENSASVWIATSDIPGFWSKPRNISTSVSALISGDDTGLQVGFAADGSVLVAWENLRSVVIMQERSDHWELVKTVTGRQPRIFPGPNRSTWITWVEFQDANNVLFGAQLGGIEFVPLQIAVSESSFFSSIQPAPMAESEGEGTYMYWANADGLWRNLWHDSLFGEAELLIEFSVNKMRSSRDIRVQTSNSGSVDVFWTDGQEFTVYRDLVSLANDATDTLSSTIPAHHDLRAHPVPGGAVWIVPSYKHFYLISWTKEAGFSEIQRLEIPTLADSETLKDHESMVFASDSFENVMLLLSHKHSPGGLRYWRWIPEVGWSKAQWIAQSENEMAWNPKLIPFGKNQLLAIWTRNSSEILARRWIGFPKGSDPLELGLEEKSALLPEFDACNPAAMSFESDIKPTYDEHCSPCHNPKETALIDLSKEQSWRNPNILPLIRSGNMPPDASSPPNRSALFEFQETLRCWLKSEVALPQ